MIQHESALDACPDGHDRKRTRNAGTGEPNLHDPVVCYPHELDVTSILKQIRSHPRQGLLHRFSLQGVHVLSRISTFGMGGAMTC